MSIYPAFLQLNLSGCALRVATETGSRRTRREPKNLNGSRQQAPVISPSPTKESSAQPSIGMSAYVRCVTVLSCPHDGSANVKSAVPEHGQNSVPGYKAGDDRAQELARYGLSVHPSCSSLARHARHCVLTTTASDLRQWVLLAYARLSKWSLTAEDERCVLVRQEDCHRGTRRSQSCCTRIPRLENSDGVGMRAGRLTIAKSESAESPRAVCARFSSRPARRAVGRTQVGLRLHLAFPVQRPMRNGVSSRPVAGCIGAIATLCGTNCCKYLRRAGSHT